MSICRNALTQQSKEELQIGKTQLHLYVNLSRAKTNPDYPESNNLANIVMY
jgi:hypothetical protein